MLRKALQMLTRSLAVFNTSYFDLTLLSTTGTDDVVGATRTFSITADNSITLTEEVRKSLSRGYGAWKLFSTDA